MKFFFYFVIWIIVVSRPSSLQLSLFSHIFIDLCSRITRLFSCEYFMFFFAGQQSAEHESCDEFLWNDPIFCSTHCFGRSFSFALTLISSPNLGLDGRISVKKLFMSRMSFSPSTWVLSVFRLVVSLLLVDDESFGLHKVKSSRQLLRSFTHSVIIFLWEIWCFGWTDLIWMCWFFSLHSLFIFFLIIITRMCDYLIT